MYRREERMMSKWCDTPRRKQEIGRFIQDCPHFPPIVKSFREVQLFDDWFSQSASFFECFHRSFSSPRNAYGNPNGVRSHLALWCQVLSVDFRSKLELTLYYTPPSQHLATMTGPMAARANQAKGRMLRDVMESQVGIDRLNPRWKKFHSEFADIRGRLLKQSHCFRHRESVSTGFPEPGDDAHAWDSSETSRLELEISFTLNERYYMNFRMERYPHPMRDNVDHQHKCFVQCTPRHPWSEP